MSFELQKIISGVPRTNFVEDMYMYFQLVKNLNGTHYGNPWTSMESIHYGFTNNTELNDIIQYDNAPIQDYACNISNGKRNLSYSVNANYFDQRDMILS